MKVFILLLIILVLAGCEDDKVYDKLYVNRDVIILEKKAYDNICIVRYEIPRTKEYYSRRVTIKLHRCDNVIIENKG